MQKSLFRPASTDSGASELHASSTGPVESPRDGQNDGVRRPPTYAFKAFDRDGLMLYAESPSTTSSLKSSSRLDE
jgi:hypothetical protein